jgi:hypothetical protein
MGSFAQRWWFRYLIDCPDSRVLPVLAALHSTAAPVSAIRGSSKTSLLRWSKRAKQPYRSCAWV